MYAIIQTGGKQFKVRPGEKLKVELLAQEIGSNMTFEKVLAFKSSAQTDDDKIIVGAPFLDHVKVKATVLSHGRHKKIKIFKMKRRKHYQKRQGHRQYFTELSIDAIELI